MNDRTLYFAYGSNMAIERLKKRIPSAKLIGVAVLKEHQLRFQKPSKRDGSGKCDVERTGDPEDKVFGVLYSIQTTDFVTLDKFEDGYERKPITVLSKSNEAFEAETYMATHTDNGLRPLDWYKEHVLRGAKSAGLPSNYISRLEAIVADIDANENRRAEELAIYGMGLSL